MTQTEAVLAELRRRGPAGLTQMQALEAVGTTRLAARIADLKADGHVIETRMVVVPTRGGGRTKVAQYVIHEEPVQLGWTA